MIKMDNMSNSNSIDATAGTNSEPNVDTDLDLKGLMCPMPLLKAKKALNELQPLQILRVQATDPGSARDFSVFASQSGHKLMTSTEEDGIFTYLIQKKA
jgi:tRNA 2-thiouridine synthesizing protein A